MMNGARWALADFRYDLPCAPRIFLSTSASVIKYFLDRQAIEMGEVVLHFLSKSLSHLRKALVVQR